MPAPLPDAHSALPEIQRALALPAGYDLTLENDCIVVAHRRADLAFAITSKHIRDCGLPETIEHARLMFNQLKAMGDAQDVTAS